MIREISYEELKDVQTDKDLREYLTSIEIIKLIVDIEEKYDIDLPDDFLLIEKIGTIEKIAINVKMILENKKGL